jgi:hypothetical protein
MSKTYELRLTLWADTECLGKLDQVCADMLALSECGLRDVEISRIASPC